MRTHTALVTILAATTLAALPLQAQRPTSANRAMSATSATTATKRPATTTAAAAKTPRAAVAPALTTYAIDVAHSELSFRVRHLLGRVSGTFGEWSGTVALDTTNWANSKVDVAIATASIDTKNAKRDEHLRAPDFFAADSFPTIRFTSTRVVKQGKKLRIFGNLTMRGVTKPAVLTGEYAGAFKDGYGKSRTAFTASTTIDRQAFGVSWNSAVEMGTMVGDEVQIDIAIQAVKQ